MRAPISQSKLLKLLGWGAVAALLALAPTASAGKFKVLHSFCGPKDGCDPEGGLVADPAGTLYGSTYTGAAADGGTVYALQRDDDGKLHYKRLYKFCRKENCSDAGPMGNLIVDTQGNLYGYADLQGARPGVVTEFSPPAVGSTRWTKKVLYSFCSQQGCPDGELPTGGLAYAGQTSGAPYDGSSPLYGVTNGGGSHSRGTVFSLAANGNTWSETVLHNFCSQGGDACTDGIAPTGVMLNGDGNIVGTAAGGGGNGGQFGAGTVFELSQGKPGVWTFRVLYAFCSLKDCADGFAPFGSLATDAAGNLVGSTASGGHKCKPDPFGCGVIFRLTPDGAQETVLYAFCSRRDCRDGRSAIAGVILDSSGNVLGTTQYGGTNNDELGLGGGVLFQLSASSYSVLHRFCTEVGCTDGEYPKAAPVLQAPNVFGTTSSGGGFDGGTVYRWEQ